MCLAGWLCCWGLCLAGWLEATEVFVLSHALECLKVGVSAQHLGKLELRSKNGEGVLREAIHKAQHLTQLPACPMHHKPLVLLKAAINDFMKRQRVRKDGCPDPELGQLQCKPDFLSVAHRGLAGAALPPALAKCYIELPQRMENDVMVLDLGQRGLDAQTVLDNTWDGLD
uniref:Uncharacterized protein n=1 Tax=Dunaliella tertiolecta TaxID=3047 RepID=A0A7S3QT40_DUNTE